MASSKGVWAAEEEGQLEELERRAAVEVPGTEGLASDWRAVASLQG